MSTKWTSAKAFMSGIRSLPSLPSIAQKVNDLLDDPHSEAKDFERVISQDQALTAKLLRLVNSAFYGLPYRVESISRAVALLGFRQIRDLITGVSVTEAFKGLKSSSLNMQSFWAHSIGCAATCRVLGILRRVPSPEVYFTAGLLHDVGRLILVTQSLEEYGQVLSRIREKDLLGYEAEQEVYGFTHADVGAELAAVWNHPDSLREALAFHHAPSEKHADLTATVHVANVIVHSFEIGYSGDEFVPPLDRATWARMELQKGVLEPALGKIDQQIEEACKSLLA